MPQDRASGAEAAAFGRDMGCALAYLLGARKVAQGSNEVIWQERRAVIKSCRQANTSFGITAAMLERLEVALVAIEAPGGTYDVYELAIDRFRNGMRDSRSGTADGRTKLLPRTVAERHGRAVASFSRAEIEVSKGVASVAGARRSTKAD